MENAPDIILFWYFIVLYCKIPESIAEDALLSNITSYWEYLSANKAKIKSLLNEEVRFIYGGS